MSITATLLQQLTVTETLDTGVDGVGSPVVVHNALNTTATLNASSTVPGTKVSSDTVALVAGAKTIDLTALPGVGGGTIDATGLKLQAALIKNPAGNGTLTVTKGASNGYAIWGSTYSVQVPPGGSILAYFADQLADVAAGVKTIDFAGTGTQSFSVLFVLG